MFIYFPNKSICFEYTIYLNTSIKLFTRTVKPNVSLETFAWRLSSRVFKFQIVPKNLKPRNKFLFVLWYCQRVSIIFIYRQGMARQKFFVQQILNFEVCKKSSDSGYC